MRRHDTTRIEASAAQTGGSGGCGCRGGCGGCGGKARANATHARDLAVPADLSRDGPERDAWLSAALRPPSAGGAGAEVAALLVQYHRHVDSLCDPVKALPSAAAVRRPMSGAVRSLVARRDEPGASPKRRMETMRRLLSSQEGYAAMTDPIARGPSALPGPDRAPAWRDRDDDPIPVDDGPMDVKPGCFAYLWQAPMPLEPAECGITAEGTHRFQVQPFITCIDDFGPSVIDALRARDGESWLDDILYDSGLMAYADVPGIAFHDLEDCLDLDHSDFGDWDAEATNHAPICSDTPRAMLMEAALWMIAVLERGVPLTVDGHPVREQVVAPIVAGDMHYRSYSPEGSVHGAYIVAGTNCKGPQVTRLESAPNNPCDTSRGYCNACPCIPETPTILMAGELKFTFSYPGATSGTVIESANNHNFLGRDTVWVCTIHLDRAAIMFDWYLGLAAAHRLTTLNLLDAGAATELVEASHKAMQSAVRMALSVAAEFATVLLHETTHNVSLYHCENPVTGEKWGCVQNIVAQAWLRYAWARFGLPRTEHNDLGALPSNGIVSSDTYWEHYLGFTAVDVEIRPKAGRDLVEPESSKKGWFYPIIHEGGLIKCSPDEGRTAGDIATGVEIGAGVIAALELAAGLALLPTSPFLAGKLLAKGVIGAGVAVGAGAADAAFEAAEVKTKADLDWQITTPLVPGGVVTHCCVRKRNHDEAICAVSDTTPCWEQFGPQGYQPCC